MLDDSSDEVHVLAEVRSKIRKLPELRRHYGELDPWLKADYAELCAWEERLLPHRDPQGTTIVDRRNGEAGGTS